MKFKQRLEMFTGQYMFIKWVGGSEYVKLMNVGDDFYEFDVIDIDTMEYQETLMIQHNLLLEVTLGGADVQRILAEMSCKLHAVNRE